jgi:hypothetical protein
VQPQTVSGWSSYRQTKTPNRQFFLLAQFRTAIPISWILHLDEIRRADMKDSVNKTTVAPTYLSVPVKYEPALGIWYRIFLFSRRGMQRRCDENTYQLWMPAAFIASVLFTFDSYDHPFQLYPPRNRSAVIPPLASTILTTTIP